MAANSNDTMNLAAAATSTYSSTFNANLIPSEGTNGSSAASNMNLPSTSTYNMNLPPTSIYNTNLPPRSAYNIPAAWPAEKRPRLSDIFMSLAEGRFENENFETILCFEKKNDMYCKDGYKTDRAANLLLFSLSISSEINIISKHDFPSFFSN